MNKQHRGLEKKREIYIFAKITTKQTYEENIGYTAADGSFGEYPSR